MTEEPIFEDDKVIRGYRTYPEVPWYRKSGVNSLLLVLHLLTCGLIPGLLLVSLVLITGNVYYDERTPEGSLKVWSTANKVVAILILLFNAIGVAYVFVGAMRAGLHPVSGG